ncbi:MAG: cytochrome c [Acidobacteriota bacterium]|nr:cytochrome c [Acidobacteriota bacterium]
MNRTFPRPQHAALALAMLLVLALAGCTAQRRLSDAELGLTPAQARGRRVFDNNCARCHQPYSSRGLHGPSLQGVYKKEFLPSGRPANDQRITETILHGRDKMPAFGDSLTTEQIDTLLSYLKTL